MRHCPNGVRVDNSKLKLQRGIEPEAGSEARAERRKARENNLNVPLVLESLKFAVAVPFHRPPSWPLFTTRTTAATSARCLMIPNTVHSF